jgi:hypothetical protein
VKVLVLAFPTAERAHLIDNLRAWGVSDTVLADSWGDFMKLAIRERPDCCLLALECLMESGREALTSTEWTLKALNVGGVISVPAALANAQYEVEAATEFELFVPAPVEMARLAPMIAQLTGVQLRPPAPVMAPVSAWTDTPTGSDLNWTDELAADLDSEFGESGSTDFLDFPITGSNPVFTQGASIPRPIVANGNSAAASSDSGSSATRATPPQAALLGPSSGRSAEMTVTREVAAFDPSLFNDVPSSFRQQIYREPERLPAPLIDRIPLRSEELPVANAAARPASEGTRERERPENLLMRAPALSGGYPNVEEPNDSGIPEEWSNSSTTASSGFRSADDVVVESPLAPPRGQPEPTLPPGAHISDMGTVYQPPPVHMVTLSGIRGGVLHGVKIPKVLFGLYTTQATGRLRIMQDNLQRDVLVLTGTFGRNLTDTTLSDEARLLGAFGWETGTYIFEEESFDTASFQSFGHPLDVIYRGISTRLSVDTVMKPLTQYLRSFPVCTTALHWIEEVPSLQRVSATLLALANVLPLERAIVSVGDSADDVLRRAYFGWLTGALMFEESPNPDRVAVQFASDFMNEDPEQLASVRRLADTMARKRKTTQSYNNLIGLSRSAPGQPAPEPVMIDPAVEQAVRELNGLLSGFANRPPHAALGLEPGCGLTALSARYYELVRLYHPDRYAKGYNDDVRALAQRVFLEIRVAHERGQMEEEAGIRTAGQGGTSPGSRSSSSEMGIGSVGAFQPVPTNPGTSAGSPAGAGQVRKVSDVLERVRARHATLVSGPSTVPTVGQSSRPATHAGASAGSATVSSGSSAGNQASDFASGPPSVRKVTTLTSRPTATAQPIASPYAGIAPEQLFRNAKRALVAGANAKALELLDAAKERGVTGPSVDAHEHYLRYSLQELSAVRVLPLLEELAKSVGQEAEVSQVYVLLGHVLRMEERLEKALEYYSKALDADKLNEEAIRWARHLRSRSEKTAGSGQGFLNKILNAKLSLSPTKK